MTFDELERGVRKLGPVPDDGGDRFFRIYCCGTLIGKTKRSRKQGRKKDVGPGIASAIPRQLNIPRELWTEIYGCRAGRREYLEVGGHVGHD